MKMKIGDLVRIKGLDKGTIGIIIDIKYSIEIYMVHFSDDLCQCWMLEKDLEVIK